MISAQFKSGEVQVGRISNDSIAVRFSRGRGDRRRHLGAGASLRYFAHTSIEPRLGAAAWSFVHGDLAGHAAGSGRKSAA